MSTYYRVDPNRNQLPQLFVIDSDGDINNLKNRDNGPCLGALKTLNNPVSQGSQNYSCDTGATINTTIYSSNP